MPAPITMFDPGTVIQQAASAADALKDVLDKKKNPVIMNGERYLEYEDWQTLARFYGYTVETGDATEVIREGKIVGFTAKAIVFQNGVKVGGAEGACMRDEPKWSSRTKYGYVIYLKDGNKIPEEDAPANKSLWVWETKNGKNYPKKDRIKVGEELVPEFQLRSMAQTRAGSKALRNVLAWVAVLAGYKPTPAEEIVDMIPEKKEEVPATPLTPVAYTPRSATYAPREAQVVTSNGQCPECHGPAGKHATNCSRRGK
jgi:hypothetical protein